MTYFQQSEKHPQNKALVNGVTVAGVTGGHETNALWISKINNDNFKAALYQSLQSANLSHVYDGAKHRLSAQILDVDQPLAGLDLTVTCKVNYKLLSVKKNKVVYDKDITTSYTATFSQAPIAGMRLQMANEGAARLNIKKFIDDLYKLPGG
jgi:hypothetical protein